MSGRTFEGTVEDGQIKLPDGVVLPENTKVYVVVPAMASDEASHQRSPRLAHSQHIQEFRKQVIDTDTDAAL